MPDNVTGILDVGSLVQPETGVPLMQEPVQLNLQRYRRPGGLTQAIRGAGDYTIEQQAEAFSTLSTLDKLAIESAQNADKFEQEAAINRTYENVIGYNPEQEDKVSFFSRTMPEIGEDFIRNNLPKIELSLLRGDTKTLVNQYPELSHLAENPEYMRRAQGQMPAYQRLYSTLRGRNDSFLTQAGGTLGRFSDDLRVAALGGVQMALETSDYVTGDKENAALVEAIRDETYRLRQEGYHADSAYNHWATNAALTLTGAVPSVAISAGSALAGMPYLGIGFIAGQESGDLYDNLRQEGVDFTTAAPTALTVGAANALVEKWQLGSISPSRFVRSTIGREALETVGRETAEGFAQETLQAFMSTAGESFALNEQLYDDGQITGTEVFTNTLEETAGQYADILAEGGAGAAVNLILGIPGVFRGMHAHHAAATQSRRWESAAATIDANQLDKRQVTYGDTMQAINGGAEVAIPVDAIDSIAQSDPDALAELMRILGLNPQAVNNARGSMLEQIFVPEATLLKPDVWKNAAIQQLKPFMSSDNAPSIVEAQASVEDSAERLGNVLTALGQVAEVDQQDAEAVELAYDNLVAAYNAAGFSKQQARTAVQYMRSADARVARLSGESLREYMNRVNFVVEGPTGALQFGRDIVSVPQEFIGDADVTAAIEQETAISQRIQALESDKDEAVSAAELENPAKAAVTAHDYDEQIQTLRNELAKTQATRGRLTVDPTRTVKRRKALVKRAGELVAARLSQEVGKASATYDSDTGITTITMKGGEVVAKVTPNPAEAETGEIILPVTETGNVNIAPVAAAVNPVPEGEPVSRGSVTFEDGRTVIRMATHSDFSTIIHEYMHALRRSWLDLAEQGNDEAIELVENLEAVMEDEFGDPDILSKQADERLAQLFEVYVREGKAPSAELVDAFSAARTWMEDAHATIANAASGFELNPEFRDVFDTMLASRDARSLLETDIGISQEVLDSLTPEDRALVEDQVEKLDDKAAVAIEAEAMKIYNQVAREGRDSALREQAEANVDSMPVYSVLRDIEPMGGFPVSSLETIGGLEGFLAKHGPNSASVAAQDEIPQIRDVVVREGYAAENRSDPIGVALEDAVRAPSRTDAIEAEYQRLRDQDLQEVRSNAMEIAEGVRTNSLQSLRDETMLLLMKISDIRMNRKPKSNQAYQEQLAADKAVVRANIDSANVGDLSVKKIEQSITTLEKKVNTLTRQIAVAKKEIPAVERVQRLQNQLADVRIRASREVAKARESKIAQRKTFAEDARKLRKELRVKTTERLDALRKARREKEAALRDAYADRDQRRKVAAAERAAGRAQADVDAAVEVANAALVELDDASKAEMAEVVRLFRAAEKLENKKVAALLRAHKASERRRAAAEKRAERNQLRQERQLERDEARAQRAAEREEAATAATEERQAAETERQEAARERIEGQQAAAEERKAERNLVFAEKLQGKELSLNEKLAELDRTKRQLSQLRIAKTDVAKTMKSIASGTAAMVKASKRVTVPGTKRAARIDAEAQGILRAMAVITGMEDYGWSDKKKRALKNPQWAQDYDGIRYSVRVDGWADMDNAMRIAYIESDYGVAVEPQSVSADTNNLADRPAGVLKRNELPGVNQLIPAYQETIPTWISALLERGEAAAFDDFTVAQAREYLSVMKAIDRLSEGRLIKQREGKRETYYSVGQAGVESLADFRDRQEWNTDTFWGRIGKWVTTTETNIHSLRQFADLAGGPLIQFDKDLATANAEHQTKYDMVSRDFMLRIGNVVESMSKRLDGTNLDSNWVPRPEDTLRLKGKPNWTPSELVAVVLNMGNLGNLQALQEGQWRLTQEHLDKITGLFTAEELTQIAEAGEIISNLWFELNGAFKDIYGGEVPRITGNPVTMQAADGRVSFDGWYYPLRYDAQLDDRVAKQEETRTTMERLRNIGVHTDITPGSVNRRVEGGTFTPLLDVGAVASNHINDVLRFVTHGALMYDIDKTMDAVVDIDENGNRVTYRKELQRTFGVDWERKLQKMFDFNAHPRRDVGVGDRTVTALRSHLSILGLGFRLKTGVKQRLSLIPAINNIAQETGVSLAAASGHTAAAALELNRNAVVTSQDVVDHISSQSPFMEARMNSTGDREVEEARRQLALKTGKVSKFQHAVREFGFEWIKMNDRATVALVFTAAKRAALSQGMSEQQAIDAAELVVRNTQPSTNPADMAFVLQQGGVMRLFTMFMHYTMMATGRVNTAVQKYMQGKLTGTQLAAQLTVEAWLPSLVLLAAEQMYQGVFGDEDDEPLNPWRPFTEPAYAYAGGLPFIRNAASMAKYKRADFGLPAPASIPWRNLRPLYMSLTTEKAYETERLAYDMAMVLELMTGVPAPSRLKGAYNEYLDFSRSLQGE